MHDLVHDLAEDVSGDNELVSLKASELEDVSEVRRLRLELDKEISATSLKSLSIAKKLQLRHLSFKQKHLRYLHLCCLDLSEVNYDQSISKLYNLETLVLTKMDIRVQNLLQNIQSLKKLRHLEVSFTYMEELPDSVTSLSNLQTLDLNNCELKALPESATGLKNLKLLDISFNPIEELPAFIINLHNSCQLLNHPLKLF
ncbi:putative disease resistance protein At3g14460 [Papaver somniferum]|uniref:putative disease resistance protein At3g14460 n=1 Tax=Papaver somniferum TaxID=3469 RepID=UPI000E7043B2|nr:putative disease resistance protein At3g14460 [Papaver somniferum]